MHGSKPSFARLCSEKNTLPSNLRRADSFSGRAARLNRVKTPSTLEDSAQTNNPAIVDNVTTSACFQPQSGASEPVRGNAALSDLSEIAGVVGLISP